MNGEAILGAGILLIAARAVILRFGRGDSFLNALRTSVVLIGVPLLLVFVVQAILEPGQVKWAAVAVLAALVVGAAGLRVAERWR